MTAGCHSCWLRKKDTTSAAIPRASGLAPSTLANALTRDWPKGKRLIACALGKRPE
ncbi:helix-turn-helix domain-containing protein [Pectobacterium versatile]|uniref:helix-turn-helix domain-containing protein n=1 Tax=Pectobacterium versatile TaxID=2488639 RepID=UPI001F16D2EC|nr:helix-turn-helix domain-containing protein [Pectobacterium versatile]